MRFLCDVHISFQIVRFLKSNGYEVIHVNELPNKWFTKDSYIAKYADDNDFIVVTKDSDFRDTFFTHNTPLKLLKINLGNISNQQLILIISQNLNAIIKLNEKGSFLLEIDSEPQFFIK